MKIKSPLFYTLFGWATLIGILTICTYSLFTRTVDQWLGIFVLFLFFGGLGIFMIYLTKAYILETTEKGIIQITLTGQKKEILWDKITSVRFSKISLVLTIEDGKNKIRTHSHFTGFNQLLDLLAEKSNVQIPKIYY